MRGSLPSIIVCLIPGTYKGNSCEMTTFVRIKQAADGGYPCDHADNPDTSILDELCNGIDSDAKPWSDTGCTHNRKDPPTSPHAHTHACSHAQASVCKNGILVGSRFVSIGSFKHTHCNTLRVTSTNVPACPIPVPNLSYMMRDKYPLRSHGGNATEGES